MNLKTNTKEALIMKENENAKQCFQTIQQEPHDGSWYADLINKAMNMPRVRVDREQFLRKELNDKVSQEVIERSIAEGTIKAGVSRELASKLAKNVIDSHCMLTTTISIVSGIPGGLVGLIGGTAVDVVQYFTNFFIMAQELMYIYGYKDIRELDSSQSGILLAMLAAASGVDAAQVFVSKSLPILAEKIALGIIEREAATSIFKKISNKVLIMIGAKKLPIIAAKDVGGAIIKCAPIIGGGVCGALTLATFKPMAKRLNKCLEEHYDYNPDSKYSIIY